MRQVTSLFVIVGLALVAFLVAAGCTGSKMRSVNVGEGEYYTQDEYDLMGASQKARYCEKLEAEMAASQERFQDKQKELQETKDLIQSIRRQIVPIEQEVLRLESDIRSLKDQIAAVKALPATWKIKPGDTLTLIAMKENIYNDIEKWFRIFEANKDKIEDPYYIFPDTVLVIPRDWPAE